MRRVVIITAAMLICFILGSCGKTETEQNNVYVPETTPAAVQSTAVPELSKRELIINLTPRQYTYEDMEYDISELKKICGDTITVEALCDTPDGRKVYDVVVGDPQGENQMLVFGAMHAREYITSQVVMRQLCGCIDAVNGYGGDYNGIPLKELLDNTTIHFIPMSNPDGVTLSQLGLDGIQTESVKNTLTEIGIGNYEQWKANANGVDLNRNFDAGWSEFKGSAAPSSDRYKGSAPGSEPEAAALIKLTQDYNMKRTISYHTCGALIYWYYKQEGAVLDESKAFAKRISDETGYRLDSDYTSVDAAGYKDWAVYKMGIPSLTIEVGNENGGGIINPVPIEQFDSVWNRNKNVVYAMAYDLKY